MRTLILSGFVMLALVGCNQKSDRDTLAQTCVANGESPETCDCITGAMEEQLSPDLFRRTAAAVGREKRDIEDFVSELPMSEQLEFASALTGMMSCELSVGEEG